MKADYQPLEQSIHTLMEPAVAIKHHSAGKRPMSPMSIYSRPMQRSRIVRAGLPYVLFERIRAAAPLSDAEWSMILDLSEKTLSRYAKEDEQFRFRRLQSERILDVAEVTDLGMAFFEDKARFREWLVLPNHALGGQRPLELLADSSGSRLLCEELGRLEHGIFS